MTPPLPPEKDIGPFYKFVGAILCIGALALFLIHAHQQRDNGWVDLGMLIVVILFVLALWRPERFDTAMKVLADKLPFLAYRKD